MVLSVTYFCLLLGMSLKLNENGEYTNIVVKIERDVPETGCAVLLSNLKVTTFVDSGGYCSKTEESFERISLVQPGGS